MAKVTAYFAAVIKLRILKCGDYPKPQINQVGLKYSQVSL